MVEVNL